MVNWIRGLFRIWIVLTVLWVGISAALFISHWPKIQTGSSVPIDEMTDEQLDREIEFLMAGEANIDAAHQRATRVHLSTMVISAIVPPGILFAAGCTCLWIARGFRRI